MCIGFAWLMASQSFKSSCRGRNVPSMYWSAGGWICSGPGRHISSPCAPLSLLHESLSEAHSRQSQRRASVGSCQGGREVGGTKMLSTAECQRQKLLRRPSLGTEARPHIPQRAAEQILQRQSGPQPRDDPSCQRDESRQRDRELEPQSRKPSSLEVLVNDHTRTCHMPPRCTTALCALSVPSTAA